MKYTENIDAVEIGELLKKIPERYNLYGKDNGSFYNHCVLPAAYHLWVYENFSYSKGVDTADIQQIIEQKEGNCVQKSIVLASLLDVFYDYRLVSVESTDGARHRLLEFKYPDRDEFKQYTAADYAENIFQFYLDNGLSNRLKNDLEMRLDSEKSNALWYVADPEMSSYIGDISSLVKKGYAYRVDDDTKFEWENPPKYYESFSHHKILQESKSNLDRIENKLESIENR